MLPIEHLTKYLNQGSMELTSYETKEIDHDASLPWKGERLPWNGLTCLAVVCYAIKFISVSERGTLRRLDDLASEYYAALTKYVSDFTSPDRKRDQMEEKEQQFSEIFVNSFMKEVRKFFAVPKMHQLSENEILAGFMDFLLQILNSEAFVDEREEHKYAILQKELRFLLAVLGDIPFQCSEIEEVKNILAAFEVLANEAGGFIYSFVFSTRPVKTNVFNSAKHELLEKVKLMNAKIKEHYIKFAELSKSVTSPRSNVVDSFFIVDTLLEDLENFMNRQSDLTTDGMKDQIKIFHKELLFTRTLLKDIKIQQGTCMDEVKECSKQIRDLAYEAEYLLNSYVAGNIPVWYLNLRLPSLIEKIIVQKVRISTGLVEITKIHDYKVLEVAKDSGEEVSITPVIVEGFEDNREKVLGDLADGSRYQKVISICGMPGLGKTTFAKKMYDDKFICDYFDERAWCVASQTYQKRRVMNEILMSFGSKPDKDRILKMEDGNLGLEIHKTLKGRRYLIVIDNVWNSNIWDDLMRYFPDDGNGSRIMFTTRVNDTAPTGSIFHTLPLMSEAQCLNMIVKKVFPKEPCPPQFLGVGKRIAAKCNGLPLAVAVAAGILANLEKEESVWEKVEQNLDSYLFDDPRGCKKILELSYDHLPNHLKPCFLYFVAFSEDTEISTRKLMWLWVAEGFVHKNGNESLEHIAEEYLSDLISRNLLMIVKKRTDGGIKACTIHDLLSELCQRKAHEENFLKLINDQFSMCEKHYHLHVNSTTPIYWRPFGLHCHSFSGHLEDPSSRFAQMALLRVLDLLPIEDNYYKLKKIDLLVHLRYLAVDRMPTPVVGNLINLKFLCIEGGVMVIIPSAVLKMVSLRHVRIKDQAAFGYDCDSSQTNNIHSFSIFRISSCKDEEILRCSPHLHKLKCICADERLFPDLHSLTKLESLKIVFQSRFSGDLTKINFTKTITKLTLCGIGLPWEEMSIVGKLEKLQVLKLLSKAFVGEAWETRDDEFQELRFLKLEKVELRKWISCNEHFPKLQCLVLHACNNLKEIPSDLGNIPPLQIIEVSYCYLTSMSAVHIEEEQREYGNEDLKVIVNNYHVSKEQLVMEYRKQREFEKQID